MMAIVSRLRKRPTRHVLIFVLCFSNYSLNLVFAQQKIDRAKAFKLKDLDRSGWLDAEEFSGGSIGKMRETSNLEFERKDTDKNGQLTVDEFLKQPAVSAEEREKETRDGYMNEFEQRDSDGDGSVLKDQYLDGLTGQQKSYAEDLFAAIDLNHDDSLDEQEFVYRPNLWDKPRIQFQWRDANRDGVLTMDEYITAESGQPWESDRRKLFLRFDKNADKQLGMDEFIALETPEVRNRQISELPQEAQLLARYDANHDSLVSQVEFGKEQIERNDVSVRQLFALLDQTADGTLNAEELQRLSGQDPLVLFAVRDRNGNSSITLAEQLEGSEEKPWEKDLRRFFSERDFDQNGALTNEEFLMAESDKRLLFSRRDLDSSDAISIEEELIFHGGTGKPWEYEKRQDFRALDTNHDGQLDRAEFVRDASDPQIVFAKHDVDEDGKVVLEEYLKTRNAIGQDWEKWARLDFLGLDISHDLTLDAQELQLGKDDPRVLYSRKDSDRDGRVSREEYLAEINGEEGLTWFSSVFHGQDYDGDGFLTFEESVVTLTDEILMFSQRDLDLSNTISIDEELKSQNAVGNPWENEKRQGFRALDTDHDGQLSRTEFVRDASDPQIVFAKHDLDDDGKVVLEEYLKTRNALGQDWEKWARLDFLGLDISHDLTLDIEELQLGNDDPRVLYSRKDADRDGRLSRDEYLVDVSDEEGAKWRGIEFRGRDRDSDGFLTFDESALTEDQVDVRFRRLDENGDSLLSAEEFLVYDLGKDWEPHHRKRFALHDSDDSGTLSLAEYQATDAEVVEERRISALPAEERTFAGLDISRDSKLSIEEFISRNKDRAVVEKHEQRFFATLDFDRDSQLDLNEFLSQDDPIPQLFFAKRDLDGNGELTVEEYIRFEPAEKSESEQSVFGDFDVDRNALLSVDEFVRLEIGRSGRDRWAWLSSWISTPMSLTTTLMIVFDVVLVFIITRVILRRWLRPQTSTPHADS